MWPFGETVIPELLPKHVGVPIPVNPDTPEETYTYNYITVGGESI